MNDYLYLGIGILISLIAIIGISRWLEKAFKEIRSRKSPSLPEEATLVLPDLPPSIPSVSHYENLLSIGSKQIQLEATIKQAIPLNDVIIVLLDSLAAPSLYGVSNLVGINYSGVVLWRAELPSGYGIKASPSHDRYIQITNVEPLEAYCSSGFVCQINLSNGNIIESEFVK